MSRGGLIESRGDRGQRTELIEVATYFKGVHLIHCAINGGGNLTFGYSTTQITKSWDTVSHETTSLQNTVILYSCGSTRIFSCSLPHTRIYSFPGFIMFHYGE